MPNLNMPGEGGARPVQPMMPKREMGGIIRILVIVVVVIGLGGGGFYLYKPGKLPFLSKKTQLPPPAAEVAPPQPEQMAPPPVTTAPPVEQPKPQPAKQEMGKGSFTVIIGAFHSKQTAEEEVGRWSNAGYPAMVTESGAGESMWYRVSLGRYETRRLAMKAGKEMEHMFEMGYWVDKVQ